MYIHGEFRDKENNIIAVHIIKGNKLKFRI